MLKSYFKYLRIWKCFPVVEENGEFFFLQDVGSQSPTPELLKTQILADLLCSCLHDGGCRLSLTNSTRLTEKTGKTDELRALEAGLKVTEACLAPT